MDKTELPQAPSLQKIIGPSFILLGLALGSGELLLWPFLAAQYGLGLLWGALLGITLQFVLNTEAMRYTLAWGESVFVGLNKLHRSIPYWFILSTVIPWSIPGFSSATAAILHRLAPAISERGLAIFLLLFTGVLLSSGKSLYKTMERFQKLIIFTGLPFLLLLTILLTSAQDWVAAGKGLIGIGEHWWLFPPGVALASFLGAFAYAGAGGNLNLAQSYYIKEKGFGMGKYMSKISTLFSKEKEVITILGQHFAHNKKNQARWKQWWRLVNQEHSLVFWGLGLFTIILLSTLAYATVYGQASGEGLQFLYLQADVIGRFTVPYFRTLFLIVAAGMLFATQVGVLESSSRIISENVLLATQSRIKQLSPSKWFYLSLWTQIIVGIVVYSLGFREPRLLITVSAILNAAAMMVSFALLYLLNRRQILSPYQPSPLRRIILILAALLFAGFLIVTIQDSLR